VGKDVPILAGDVLVFAGDVHKVHDLLKVRGLRPTNQEGQILAPIPGRILAEAIVGPRSSLIGKSIRESHFRHLHESAVISIYREGLQLKGKVGDMIIQPGDALLLVTKPDFVDNHKAFYDSDFVWVSRVGEHPIHFDHVKMITAVLVAITLYVLTAVELVDLATVSLISAFTLIFTQCVTLKQAFDSIDISVLVVIATSFSTALAIEKTGVAAEWASNLLQATEFAGDIGVLTGTYLATTILTAVLSNVSAAAIMVPIAFSLRQNAPIKALLYVVMHGASADFSTPIGYQTNLMVWGPGGYRFGDYFRVGFPLQICCCIVTIVVSYFAFTERN
jgi:di/tricarboxylate transporter